MLRKDERGIGLVEVIAALGISVVVITSLVSLTVFTLRSSQRSKVALESSKEANKTLELLRAKRDTESWWDSLDPGSSFLGNLGGAVGSPECFVDAVDKACVIDDNLTVTQIDPPTNIEEFTASQVTTYFRVADPINGGFDPENMSVVRVSVYSVTRVGNQLKTNNLYTDLTNWRDR